MRFIGLGLILAGMMWPGLLWAQDDKLLEEEKAAEFIEQPCRIEFDAEDGSHDFHIVGAEKEGLLVVRETGERQQDGYEWEFTKLDTALNEQWVKSYSLPFNYYFLGYDYSPGSLYILFVEDPSRPDDFTLMRMHLENGDTSLYVVNSLFPIQLTEFEVLETGAIFGGNTNYRPVVMHFDLQERKPKVLPGIYNRKTELLEIKTDDRHGFFTVLTTEKTRDKRTTISVKNFAENGEFLVNETLTPDEEKSLLYGETAMVDGSGQYMAGTYAYRKSDFSRGVYLAKLDNGKQDYIRYHNYADLTNFFAYMSAKREARVKNRIKRRKVQGKKLKFNYRLLVHDIIKQENQYVMIGEAYYPKYSAYSYGPYTGYSGGLPSNQYFNPGFEGYRYTHAVVIGFDRNGNVIWDNSFEINDVTTYNLDKFVSVGIDSEEVILLYVYDNIIRSKLVRGNEIIEGKAYNPLKLKFEDDIVKQNNDALSGLEEWYDNNFYAYGHQKIKNLINNDVKLNRDIFYINKIVYR